MRQQFLASKMEAARELGADVVSLLHISPDANDDFKRVTSPQLIAFGATPTEIWKSWSKRWSFHQRACGRSVQRVCN